MNDESRQREPDQGIEETARPAGKSSAGVIRPNALREGDAAWLRHRLLPAWLTSGGVHLILVTLFLLITLVTPGPSPAPERPEINTAVDTDEPPRANLENDEIGLNPSALLNYNLERIESASVPGVVNPNELVG